MEILSKRQQQVLSATVHHYVDTMEPVGSKTLVQRFGFKASSSTVRSAMGVLDKKGLLNQPHISSGRIPSPLGYRHYVDCLLPPPGASAHHLQNELTDLSLIWASFDDLLWQLSRRLTDFTGLMSLITRPTGKNCILKEIRLVQNGDRLLVMLVESSNQVSHLNLRLPFEIAEQINPIESWICSQLENSVNGEVDWSTLPSQLCISGSVLKDAIYSHKHSTSVSEGGAIFHGISRLAAQPEFSDSKRFQPILDLIDRHPTSVIPLDTVHNGSVWIGNEHPQNELSNCSVVKASYSSSNGGVGHVALIGPMRMAYATSLAAVKSVAQHLERILL